jgi:hypothetical protein
MEMEETMNLKHSFLALLAAASLAACQASTNDRVSTGDKGAVARDDAPAADKAPQAAAAPRATPRPRPQPVLIPAGTRLTMALQTTVSSATNHPGDVVVARLTEPVRVGDKVVIPEGSRVTGRVTAAVPSGRVKGRARLALTFDSIEWTGHRADIETSGIDITAESSKKHDAALVGAGAGAGAIIGGIAKGGKGAAVGALIGAGAGGGAVLATKGKEVHLQSGGVLEVRLTDAARVV